MTEEKVSKDDVQEAVENTLEDIINEYQTGMHTLNLLNETGQEIIDRVEDL